MIYKMGGDELAGLVAVVGLIVFYLWKKRSSKRGPHQGGYMATGLDSKQIVTFEELLISQMIEQEALTRLLIEKGIFSKEELLEKVREVDHERKTKR
jgi:hypothetical protein